MVLDIRPNVTQTVTTQTVYELSEDDVAELLRRQLGLGYDAEFTFNVGQIFKGCTVTVIKTETKDVK